MASRQSADDITLWCCAEVAKMLGRPRERIDPDAKLSRLGLDSATAVYLMVALEDWLGLELAPELAFEFPTLRKLSAEVAALAAGRPG